tara:strand:+ start:355 stop:540 length:186 start_codon:yes stop_codon:yes gene_type:complete
LSLGELLHVVPITASRTDAACGRFFPKPLLLGHVIDSRLSSAPLLLAGVVALACVRPRVVE